MRRKVNDYSTFNAQVQDDIIGLLGSKELNTRQIANRLGRPYHTVRANIRTMLDEGLIVPTNFSGRDTPYKIAGSQTMSDRLMPIIMVNRKKHKINVLLFQYHNDITDTAAYKAILNVGKHATRILQIAKAAHQDQATGLQGYLNSLRNEIETDREALLNIVDLYTQLLEHPKFWDITKLARFPDDNDWDEGALQAALKHYYPQLKQQVNLDE